MAYFDPEQAFDTLKSRISESVSNQFPIAGKKNTLVANKVWVDDDLESDDIRSQKDAKLKGRTWAVPVRAELELRDNATGKVTDRKTVTVAQLPKITRRYSYIVNGSEYQINNLFRLKSGVYSRVADNGELEGQWNLAKGMGFRMKFDPESKKMAIKYKTGATVPLYPVLKTLGVSDDELERQWGREILSANMADKEEPALRKFFKTFNQDNPADVKEAQNFLRSEFGKTELRPDSTAVTLGKPFKSVDGPSLLAGSEKLLKISRGVAEPDDRDSLAFKELWSTEDLVAERIDKKYKFDIQRKIRNTLDKHTSVRDIVNPEFFGKPVRSFFSNSSLAERPDQMNPISFTAGNRRTTTLGPGEGGMSSPHQLSLSAKAINQSHPGFLDPIQTPEGDRTGVNLQLASAVEKHGKELRIQAFNTRTKKMEWVTPAQTTVSTVAFPDQYQWKGAVPVPIGPQVKVSDKDGTITSVSPSKVDYVLPTTKGMFDITANLMPFLSSDNGNRAMMAAKQFEQAVPLVHREAPLVQVKGDKDITFEKALGVFNSHRAPVSGVVKQVKKDAIVLHDKDGNRREVQIYNDFPLNDSQSLVNSTPLVKVGDTVKKGQVIADSNYTKDGVLAIGTNLRVAYTPYKGYNFEDGIVISDTAAKKLTSEHMHRETVTTGENLFTHKNKFLAASAGKVSKEQAEKLDDSGVIREGSVVYPGDILIGALRQEIVRPEDARIALFDKKLLQPVKPRPVTWTKDIPGVVNQVVRHGNDTTVFVKAFAPATIGDKMVGRHGNKGIITSILPDNEMPHDKDGKPVDVLLNPAGVPTRINLGQVLETAASKIAKKTGQPYIVTNFDASNQDYTRNLSKELDKLGLSDTEDLIDPTTGKTMKDVLVGDQYILKLKHTVEKKLQARSRDAYDSNLTPKGGGPKGGQSMDMLGLYSLLAHNARANIREMQTSKSDFNDDFWTSIQAGEPIPPPKVPFVHKKFEGYLKGMGVDVHKDGNSLILGPITDDKIKEMSEGRVIEDPALMLRAKDLRPEKGGLFDPTSTGTTHMGQLGDKWSHFELASRLPNPMFEKPIRALLGLNTNQFDSVISGDETFNGKTGPAAIVAGIAKIDVKKKLDELGPQLKKLTGTALNNANKQVKYLKALEQTGLKPVDAYTQSLVPVLPPVMRPYAVLDNGQLKYDDVNEIYKQLGALNDQVKKIHPAMLEEDKVGLQADLYDGLKGLSLTGITSRGRHFMGIGETLAGKTQAKEGFFQRKVLGRRQDLSMRGTIVPEPSLSLDEVALPRKAAAEIYKPFTIRRLVRLGYNPGEAQRLVNQNNPLAVSALENEVLERPILLKRDPVLHKFGVQAFKPILTDGKAVKIHPLVTGGYNADFDGDTMSAFVPLSQEAVQEAFKMVPSRNLFSPAHGKITIKPGHEALLGLFKMSEMGKSTNKSFVSAADLAKGVQDGTVRVDDVVTIKNPTNLEGVKLSAAPLRTTAGRLLIYNALPEGLRDKKILTDSNFVMNKGTIENLLTETGRNYSSDFTRTADALKDMGNKYATGFSISLKDFFSDRASRDPVFKEAAKKEAEIRNSKMSRTEKDDAVIDLYTRAGQKVDERVKANASPNNRMYDWIRSRARGDFDQYKQMVSAPVLVTDSSFNPVPIPITKSFSEGLDISSYWATMHGARMGTIGRAQGSQEPGKMTKQLMNVSMDQLVIDDDCGTKKGIALPTMDRDTLGRYTAEDIKLGTRGGKDKGVIPAGTLVDTSILNRLKNNKVDSVMVRSPLKCAHGHGLCAKCYGLGEDGQNYAPGTNVGIFATHALGEPMTQLAMDAFHHGGVVGAKGSSMDKFKTMKQLVEVPAKLPGAATLAVESGEVEKIQRDPAGGWSVFVGGARHYVPERRTLLVKRGDQVKKGDSITDGPKNPHELLALTDNMNTVQRYLANEIYDVYKDSGPVKRRNVETFVRAFTNLSKVEDPGDHPDFLPGDRAPTSVIREFNDKAKSEGMKPVVARPLLKSVAMLPRELETDWVARMNGGYIKQTLMDAAAEGWKSRIHSAHPVPAMTYGAEFGKGTKEEPYLY